MFSCAASFPCVFDETFIEVPWFLVPLLFEKPCVLNVWQCSEYSCHDNCSVICTLTWCYVKQQTHSEFWNIQDSVFWGIFWHIKLYSTLLSHIHTYWNIIKAYLAPCIILTYWQSCHILSLGIFRTGSVFKTLWNVNQAYWEPCTGALFIHI